MQICPAKVENVCLDEQPAERVRLFLHSGCVFLRSSAGSARHCSGNIHIWCFMIAYCPGFWPDMSVWGMRLCLTYPVRLASVLWVHCCAAVSDASSLDQVAQLRVSCAVCRAGPRQGGVRLQLVVTWVERPRLMKLVGCLASMPRFAGG